MTPSKTVFEERYSDDSGIEYSVTYDFNKGNPVIKMEHVGDIEIPVSKADWFIECLTKIKKIEQDRLLELREEQRQRERID